MRSSQIPASSTSAHPPQPNRLPSPKLRRFIRLMSAAAASSGAPPAAAASSAPATKRVVTFVTGNLSKLRETQQIFGDSLTLQAKALDLPELQGDPLDIARSKVITAASQVEGPVLTEDTSLCFHALQGLPGPYVKWFLDKTGHAGLNNMLAAYQDKSAYAQCIFAYSSGRGAEPVLFDGRCEGSIVPARGPLNFGWDPVFQPKGFDRTFAEMDKETKNRISHRAKAIEQVKAFFAKMELEEREKEKAQNASS